MQFARLHLKSACAWCYQQGYQQLLLTIQRRHLFWCGFFLPPVRVFCMLALRHAESRAGVRLRQPDEDEDLNYCQQDTAGDGALDEQHLRDCQDNEKIIPTI
jgi:hypothetical protein